MSAGKPRSRFEQPRFAEGYVRLSAGAEARGQGAVRRDLLSAASGTVLEVGAGHGLNFPHYPPGVSRVLAVEPEPTLARGALQAARDVDVPVRVVAADAQALPCSDSSIDVVVYTLVLCSVDDQRTALREARRVLRPGGLVLFYEHVRSSNPLAGALEDVITPLWRRFAAGCHPNRDTAAVVAASGFVVEELRRFPFAPSRGIPPTAHVAGRARRAG